MTLPPSTRPKLPRVDDERPVPPRPETKKRPYVTPTLIFLGDVHEMTLGNAGSRADGLKGAHR